MYAFVVYYLIILTDETHCIILMTLGIRNKYKNKHKRFVLSHMNCIADDWYNTLKYELCYIVKTYARNVFLKIYHLYQHFISFHLEKHKQTNTYFCLIITNIWPN